ncbi:MAG TPA: GAF domain-containing protein [Candidatus Dormibacteraeota bacterium]|nr:GAF domain-containing protein [Candidatus Dormibacteraeota bacterium]
MAVSSPPELQAVFQEVVQSLAGERPLRATLDMIVRHLSRLAGFSFCGIVLPDEDRTHVHLAGAFNFPDGYAERLDHLFLRPVEDDALAGAPTRRAFEQGRTVVVPDVTADSSFAPWLDLAREFGYRAMVSVPLHVQGQVIGVLNGYSQTARRFSAEELAVVETMAGQAAVAVRLATLLDDQQATIARLRELNEELERQRTVLERAHDIHRRLTAAVLTGSGFEEVVRALAELIERPAAAWDAAGRLVCASPLPPGPELEGRFHSSEFRRRLSAMLAGRPACSLPAPGGNVIVGQVRIGGELLGYVTVPEGGAAWRDLDLRAVEHAATVLALEIVKERVARETEERLRSDFALDLLHRRYESEERVVERARYYGLDLRAEHRVLTVGLDGWGAYQKRQGLSEAAANRLRARLLQQIGDGIDRALPGSLLHTGGEGVTAICPADGPATVTLLRRVVADLQRRVERAAPHLTVSAGIGAPARSPGELAASYEQATRCLQAEQALGRSGRCLCVDDLGVLGLFLEAGRPASLVEFARARLGPALQHDARTGGALRRTLEAYLEAKGDLATCARALSVHVNTVKYRLHRIEQLCGLDLRDPQDLLAVTISSLALRVLGEARPPGG